MKRRLAVLLCAASLCGGCASWRVQVFDQPIVATETTSSSDLSKEEKGGVLLIVGIALAAVIAGVVAAN